MDVLEQHGYDVVATDIDMGVDFLTCADRADTIVTNPPYSLLDPFILHALGQANLMVCMLVGWHLLAGGQRRADTIWTPHPPTTVLAVVNRMPLADSTSQFNHAWAIWDLDAPRGPTKLYWTTT